MSNLSVEKHNNDERIKGNTHAIVVRYDLAAETMPDKIELSIGRGVIFYSGETMQLVDQDEYSNAIKKGVDNGTFEAAALLDRVTGILMFNRLSNTRDLSDDKTAICSDNFIGILIAEQIAYGLVWGDSEAETSQTLKNIEYTLAHLN